MFQKKHRLNKRNLSGFRIFAFLFSASHFSYSYRFCVDICCADSSGHFDQIECYNKCLQSDRFMNKAVTLMPCAVPFDWFVQRVFRYYKNNSQRSTELFYFKTNTFHIHPCLCVYGNFKYNSFFQWYLNERIVTFQRNPCYALEKYERNTVKKEMKSERL